MLKAVEVFKFGAGAKSSGPPGAKADVDVTAKAAFLHGAVTYLEYLKGGSEIGQKGDHLIRVVECGFGHDFKKGDAGPVEVDVGKAIRIRKTVVEELSGIFF
jgi:hypothetical protein